MKEKLFTKNFTLLVLGQVSSLFGNYILRLALSMYVLELTGSAAVFAGLLSAATIPTILRILLLAALSRFFVMGVTLVGLPFLVRTVLGLDARYYGAAESVLAVAVIAGSMAAGVLAGKIQKGGLSAMLAAVGLCIVPAGLAFLLPAGTGVRYAVLVAAFCGMQIAISMFSIYAVSMIQQGTPEYMIGKVMAYTSAITMCAQPAGQMVYGFLFDGRKEAVWLVLIPTGVIVCGIGVAIRTVNLKEA